MNGERDKHWLLTQERALEIYELIQSSLDPSTWEVLIKSENVKMPIGEFIEQGRQRSTYFPENNRYNPSVVAEDSLTILEALPVSFDNLRNRLEDSFRSLLVVNEDMTEFINGIEGDTNHYKDEVEHLRNENESLKKTIFKIKDELRRKEAGIQPLNDIIKLRVGEIIKLYNEFKTCIGNEEDMKKFLPIFEKEVDTTIKLIKLKEKQILESKIDWGQHVEEMADEGFDNFLPPEEKEEDEPIPDDDAEFINPEDEPEFVIPAGLQDLEPIVVEAVMKEHLPRKPEWSDEMYEGRVRMICNDIIAGRKPNGFKKKIIVPGFND